MTQIDKSTYKFLKDLRKNNDRPWFEKNKDKYTAMHQNMIAFAEDMMQELGKSDKLVPMTGKKSLFRIYRDVRFSKDKTPYKSNMGGGMKRDTQWLRGGYYYQVEPGNTFIAMGFWNPNTEDIKLIRDNIAQDDKPLRKILNSKKIKDTFTFSGAQLKTAPRGFDKDHSAVDLLRYKQMILSRTFTDKEGMDKNFLKECVKTFKASRPFLNYMSEILTHDLNGEPLY